MRSLRCFEDQLRTLRNVIGQRFFPVSVWANDGCYVEQKNWARVRELVGYYRYDTGAELDLLNQIWQADDAFANYFLPSLNRFKRLRLGALQREILDHRGRLDALAKGRTHHDQQTRASDLIG